MPPCPRSAALLGAALALVACSAAPGAPGPATPVPTREVAVRTAPVARADLLDAATYSGEVRARATVDVVPKQAGRIERLHVEVGARVRAGDPIADLERSAPELAVRQAEAALAGARARLAQAEAGGRPDQVAQAEAAARAARFRAESVAAGGRAEAVAQASAALDSARQRLTALTSPREEVVAQADAAVAAARARLEALQKGTPPEELRAREIAVEQARRALEAAWKQRDGACGFGPSPACQQARAAAIQAEAAVRAAEQQVQIARAPATAEAVAQARAALDAETEQARLARQPGSESDLAQARNAVRSAEAAVALARQPALPGDVEAARAQAEAAAAQAQLAAAPVGEPEIAAARAAVEQAQAQLDLVRLQLAELTVVAPVDGLVSERQLVPGAIASPATPIVTIVSAETEIAVPVDEARLPRVRAGQEALIAVPAFPGELFPGKVLTVAPAADPRSRTARVTIQPTADALGKLRPGMFADARLIFERKSGVLAIPRLALVPGDAPAVFVIENGRARRAPVELGLRDGERVEVLGGLQEGEAVVLEPPNLQDGQAVAPRG